MKGLLSSLLLLPVAAVCAQPDFRLLRQDEDPVALKEALEGTFLEPFKHRPLGPGFLTVGGEIRLYGEYYGNPDWGREEDDAYLLHRYTLHADYRTDHGVRFFGQLYSARISGRNVDPSPVEENRLTAQQLFADFQIHDLTLRLGRQEMRLGSQRLVGVREGPNVRRAFTGLRATLGLSGEWTADTFYLRPVAVRPGSFDDDWWPEGEALWGVYATGSVKGVPGSVDLYYLGQDRDEATFNQGTADERRHTVGIRWFGTRDALDWNLEAIGQWGSFGDGDIRAWSFASEVGYRFTGLPLSPRFSVKANIASGDNGPGDGDLGTFNPLYPKGNYFGESALVGPSNFFDLYVAVEWNPTPQSHFKISYDAFFRHRESDGIYAPPVRLVRSSSLGPGRAVGQELSVMYEHRLTDLLFLNLAASRFFTDTFLENDPESRDVTYAGAWLTAKF